MPKQRKANHCRVVSGLVARVCLTHAVSQLIAPAWGADMAAADRAQALIAVWQPPEDPEHIPEPFAALARTAAVIGDDPQAALAVLGLTDANL